METEEHVEVLLCGYVPEVSRSVKPSGYICGDCGQSVMISSEATVRCGLCGYRILYKARQRHCRQYLAR
jgi:DNA-directed RNA polymerase subunit RPC12/RpoP